MIIFPILMGNACATKNATAFATINEKGRIEVKAERNTKSFENVSLPFFRGIAFFVFGVYLFVKYLINSNNFEKNKEKSKKNNKKSLKISKNLLFLIISILIGFILGFMVLTLVPYFCFNYLGKTGMGYGLICFISALLRLSLFFAVLLVLKLIPSVKQFYRHNSAGNIAYKNHIGNISDNYHLSTNFLSYLITCFSICLFILSFTSFNIFYIWRFLINLAIIMFVFSGIYEIMKLLEKNNGVLNNLFVKPFSFFITNKPGKTEKHIANTALGEAKLMEENKERLIDEISGKDVPMSVVLSEVKEKLLKAGIEDASEAEWLVAEALNKNRSEIKLRTTITKEEYKKVAWATAKREKHIPLTKIFNRANFYGYDFYVDKSVLSPRPETELLVEEVIKEINSRNNKKIKVLDLCTGSGCIATVISKRTGVKVFASDISESALSVAKKNVQNNDAQVKFINSDLFNEIKDKFDIIVSNPPYIKSQDILSLEDEVKRNDPLISLDGGEDGLYFYKEIAKNAPKHLNKNGKIFLEVGIDQAKIVKKLLQNDFENIKIKKDYNDIDRMVIANLKGKSEDAW